MRGKKFLTSLLLMLYILFFCLRNWIGVTKAVEIKNGELRLRIVGVTEEALSTLEKEAVRLPVEEVTELYRLSLWYAAQSGDVTLSYLLRKETS